MLSQVCLNFSRFSDSEILANEELQELEKELFNVS